MDYPKDNVFTFLFSTYKRTAGIAFMIVLILAVPITIALVGRQQDIRQRASLYIDFNCGVFNGDPASNCPAGCAYYACSNTCHPPGTPESTACSTLNPINSDLCRAHNGDLNGCNQVRGCAYYSCTNQCLPTGTSIDIVCHGATPTPVPNQQVVLNQQKFDFNDDGKVDQIDLNILYAGFAKRQGD